jgi:predicted DCC family thiol-disulfide oxidoreductase YuxK
MSEDGRIQVLTDGECPLCRWSRAQVEPRDRERRIEWLNYRDPEVISRIAPPYTFEELNAEMHVRDAGGRWTGGYPAWLELMRVLPRWRHTVPLLSLWPFTSLGPLFYRWLASRRYSLFGVPPPCDESGVCSLHKSK